VRSLQIVPLFTCVVKEFPVNVYFLVGAFLVEANDA
jgi:hypothetical protein